MFNYVFCEGWVNGPIPEKQTMSTAFQTKSLLPLNLDIYYITYDNAYILPWTEYGNIDENGKDRDNMYIDIEWLREHVGELTPFNLNGAISFYTTINGKWVEYVAAYKSSHCRRFCYLVNYDKKRLVDFI